MLAIKVRLSQIEASKQASKNKYANREIQDYTCVLCSSIIMRMCFFGIIIKIIKNILPVFLELWFLQIKCTTQNSRKNDESGLHINLRINITPKIIEMFHVRSSKSNFYTIHSRKSGQI